MCLLYDGNYRRLNRKWFYGEPGIEPATPGLQGIALIYYTTGAATPGLQGIVFVPRLVTAVDG